MWMWDDTDIHDCGHHHSPFVWSRNCCYIDYGYCLYFLTSFVILQTWHHSSECPQCQDGLRCSNDVAAGILGMARILDCGNWRPLAPNSRDYPPLGWKICGIALDMLVSRRATNHYQPWSSTNQQSSNQPSSNQSQIHSCQTPGRGTPGRTPEKGMWIALTV